MLAMDLPMPWIIAHGIGPCAVGIGAAERASMRVLPEQIGYGHVSDLLAWLSNQTDRPDRQAFPTFSISAMCAPIHANVSIGPRWRPPKPANSLAGCRRELAMPD